MKLRPTRYFAWAAVLLFTLWTLSGCIPAGRANSSPLQPTASSTPQAELTALEVVVERLRGGQSSELQKFDAVDVRVNDQIAVKEHGHGLLRFPDRLLVELFHDTTLHIDDVRLEQGKSVFVRMKQTLGTSLTQLNAEAQARVEVDTDYATITSIEGETQLLICHAKPVTCLVTLKGGALVEAQGQSVVVEEGEATYIFPGEAPRPTLCAKMDEVTQWMDKKRGAEQVDPLGKIVAGWPQEPCSATANPSPPQPTASSPPQAELTALEVVVERLRDGQPFDVQQLNTVDIQVDDEIAIKEHGQGLLRFPDRLLVELFHDTTLHIGEVRLEPGKSIFMRLKQTLGTSLTQLNAQAQARVEVATDHATITSLEGDTQLLVSNLETETCVVALKGTALVEAQGQTVTVPEGEATYIFPGEPPKPALCATKDEVMQWIDRRRGAQPVEPLLNLLVEWPQQPCSVASSGPSPAPSAGPAPASAAMVRIPAGQYVVGVPGGDDFHMPAQEITLDDFWIDQYEVTNAQYQAFLDQTGHPAPVNGPGEGNHPVTGVSWDDAVAYCAWADKRLPTEAEWEVAARGPGPEPPLYPWGPDPSAGGQVDQLPLLETYAVGSYAFNQSPAGAYDMAGNVWEWVGEPYGPLAEGYQMLRGGRHGLLKDMAYRQPAQPTDERFLPVTGFRCAASRVAGE
jgi:formylglycine-generating enzyme required for sulfatase activity